MVRMLGIWSRLNMGGILSGGLAAGDGSWDSAMRGDVQFRDEHQGPEIQKQGLSSRNRGVLVAISGP